MGGKQQHPGHGYQIQQIKWWHGGDKEEIWGSIALADAQVAHKHEFFLNASNAQFGGRWTLASKQKTKEDGCQKMSKSPLKDAVLERVAADRVDFPMDVYTKALCKEEYHGGGGWKIYTFMIVWRLHSQNSKEDVGGAEYSVFM
jgi:hypothetical protein